MYLLRYDVTEGMLLGIVYNFRIAFLFQVRLQKVIAQQCQTIQTVNRNVAVQRAVTDKQEKEIKELKKALSVK